MNFKQNIEAPEYLILGNRKWGTKEDIKGTIYDYEDAIIKRFTSVHIVKNLHGDLWDDVKESITEERARTMMRVYTVMKIALALKNEPLFLENLREEFEFLDEPRQLKTIMNYNKYIKYGQWITRQYGDSDPEVMAEWNKLDMYINEKEQQIRERLDNILFNLENDLFETLDIDRVTDTIEFIQDDKGTVLKATSTRCECGGRYTDHNLYKHLRTDRHIRFKGGTILGDDKKILCECGETINKYQYIRHTATISHNYKLKLKRQQKEREAKTELGKWAYTETIELTN